MLSPPISYLSLLRSERGLMNLTYLSVINIELEWRQQNNGTWSRFDIAARTQLDKTGQSIFLPLHPPILLIKVCHKLFRQLNLYNSNWFKISVQVYFGWLGANWKSIPPFFPLHKLHSCSRYVLGVTHTAIGLAGGGGGGGGPPRHARLPQHMPRGP